MDKLIEFIEKTADLFARIFHKNQAYNMKYFSEKAKQELKNNHAYAEDYKSLTVESGMTLKNGDIIVGLLDTLEFLVVAPASRRGVLRFGLYGINTPYNVDPNKTFLKIEPYIDERTKQEEEILVKTSYKIPLDKNSGKFNTDMALKFSKFTNDSDYFSPACEFCRKSFNISYDLPNINELGMIYEIREILDKVDKSNGRYTFKYMEKQYEQLISSSSLDKERIHSINLENKCYDYEVKNIKGFVIPTRRLTLKQIKEELNYP